MKNLILLIVLLLMVVACGGHGNSDGSRTGSVRLQVQWPSTRDIPPATRSLRVLAQTLLKNDDGQFVTDKEVGEKVVSRPEGETTSTVTLDDLPSVKVRVKVTAYESTNGTGQPIALGTKDVEIAAGETASVTITVHADITTIEADPESLSLGAGETKTLTAQGLDSTGTPTIIEDSRWTFTSLATNIATVAKRASPNGHIADVRGVAQGDTTIRIEDALTGLSEDVPVTVGAPTHCSSYFARMRGASDTGFKYATVSGAYALWNGVFATIFAAGTGEARSKTYLRVNAPQQTGTFTFQLETSLFVKDENPTDAPNSGRVSIKHPAGTDSLNVFVDARRSKFHTLTVRHGEVLEFEMNLSVSSSASDTGVTATGDIYFQNVPSGVSFEQITCGEDED